MRKGPAWVVCQICTLSLIPGVVFWGVLWFAKGGETQKQNKPLNSPLTTKQAQAEFRLAPGLRIELIACEPQVQSPVAMTFDETGKLWVVEMRDYPNGPPPGKPPQGQIRILKDQDGDGFYEHSSVFADQLLFANGLLRWRDGVIVTQAPNIIFLRDSDGDGRADQREILYEGFAAENPQLRVSHPNLGVDGWVYVANGLRGGKVKKHGQPDSKAVSLSGMDFRFDMLSGKYEAISGLGQFGNTFDDWGRRFVCDNRHHLRHIVMPNRYLQRNPYLAVPQVLEDISVLEDGIKSSGGKIYPLSKNWTTSNLHAGHFTAACGVYIYRSGLLPKEFYGNAFTCDPTGNLVHREVLRPKGATFLSKPARSGVEFLATPDDWCRPVFLSDGPNGALYMIDMYRAVIEHPQFMPPELKNRPDLTLGKEKGRIWRIVPEGYKNPPIRPKLHKATTSELVKLLCHPNAWQRINAQRLLLQKLNEAVWAPLKELCYSEKDPRGRLLALWLMHKFAAANENWEPLLLPLLKDGHPRIREHAVLLAENHFESSNRLREQVASLAKDPDPRVRFQVALSLGEWDDDRIIAPLAKIAVAGADDRWTRYAVASSVPERAGRLFAALLKQGLTKKKTGGHQELLKELAALVGARKDQKEMVRTLEALLELNQEEKLHWQFLGLQGIAEGMNRRGTQLGTFLRSLPSSEKPVAMQTMKLLSQSVPAAKDNKRSLTERLTAISLLAHVSWDQAKPALTDLLRGDPLKDVQSAAVRSFAAHSQPEVAAILLRSWTSYTPALRGVVTSTLLRRSQWIEALLAEVEAGRVKAGDLDALSTRRLLNHSVAKIRAKARKLLQGNLPAERKKVLAQYQAALQRKGNAKQGRKIFETNCATCHQIGSLGTEVGPLISDTRVKTKQALLNDILNPNQAIDNNYVNYLVMTKSGKVLNGIVVTETASSITLRRAENETDVVLRQDIDEITSTGVSLMPEGLEKDISVEQMADLLAFLKNWRYLDGEVPLGK